MVDPDPLPTGDPGVPVAVVTVCVDRDEAHARSVAEQVGGRAVVADVRDEQAAAALANSLDRCDALVNNAGTWRFTSLADTSVDSALEVLHVNVVGTLIWMKALVPLMGGGAGGSVVNLTSVTCRATATGAGLYPPSKAAIISLTKVAALEYAALGVRVNAVGPGMVVTEGTLPAYGESAQAQRERGDLVPLGRLGAPDDIAGAVAFLCSTDASYMTGQVLWVDGGFSDAGNDYFRLAKRLAAQVSAD
jgi:3-oxoacyl-[acyl-carrier protein] reductase